MRAAETAIIAVIGMAMLVYAAGLFADMVISSAEDVFNSTGAEFSAKFIKP